MRKVKLPIKPSNADVCYRVICCIYNISNKPEYEKSASLMAYSIATQLKDLYGPGVGGKLIDDLEKMHDECKDGGQ